MDRLTEHPVVEPICSDTKCHVALLEGTPVALWTPPDVETKVHEVPARLAEPYNFVGNPQHLREAPLSLVCVELCLAPDRLIVIGRANGHRVP